MPPRREGPDKQGWSADRRPFDSPAGFRMLIPGWPQFFWGQGEAGAGAARLLRRRGRRGCPGVGDLAVLVLLRVRLPRPRQLDHRRAGPGFVPRLFATHRRADDRGLAGGPPRYAGDADPGRYRVARSAPDRTRSVYLVNCWAYRGAGPSADTGSGSDCRPRAGSMRPAWSPSPGRKSSGRS